MKKVFMLLPLVLLLTGCGPTTTTSEKPIEQPTSSQSAVKGTTSMTLTRIEKSESVTKQNAIIEMSNGAVIKIALYPELAPNTVANFITKAKSGFYNGLTFHRVEDWVVQGGDPQGTGTGGGQIAAEYNNRTFKVGSIGVARGGDTNINNDSQFFVTTKDSSFLDKNYTNFGDVIEGMDKVQLIKIGDKIKAVIIQD